MKIKIKYSIFIVSALLLIGNVANAQTFNFSCEETVQSPPNYDSLNVFEALLLNTSSEQNDITVTIDDSQIGSWGFSWCWLYCFPPGTYEITFTMEPGQEDTVYIDFIPYLPQSDGTIFVTAYSESDPTYSQTLEFVVTETSPVRPVDSDNVPADFQLGNAYPNPFNPGTRLGYSLNNSAEITVSVYNILGQEIRRIFSGIQSAGSYEIEWNGLNSSGLSAPAGVYYITLQNGNSSLTRKVVKLN